VYLYIFISCFRPGANPYFSNMSSWMIFYFGCNVAAASHFVKSVWNFPQYEALKKFYSQILFKVFQKIFIKLLPLNHERGESWELLKSVFY